MRPEEVLKLRFNGGEFSIGLSTNRSQIDPLVPPPELSAETWWSELSQSQREFIQELVGMVRKLQRDSDKVVEIRNSGGSLKVKLVLQFKEPIFGGRPEMN